MKIDDAGRESRVVRALELPTDHPLSPARSRVVADRGQLTLLAEIEVALPVFFGSLVSYAYRGYYTDPRVQAAVGFEPRPPHPRGHELPIFDAELLERQRQRAPFWRPTS